MLAHIRQFLNTRVARLFFVVLIVPFVLFGLANVARDVGGDAAVATVGDRKIEGPEFQAAFRQNLNGVMRQNGGTEPTLEQRHGIAAQTLDILILQAAIADQVRKLGLAVPDEALRRAVFEVPDFRGVGGTFDRNRFNAVMANNNLSEARYLEQLRTQLGQRQLLESVQAGVGSPATLVNQVFALQRETRTADVVELPFSAAAEPPAPTAEDLQRAYKDDPSRYSAPAYRTIKTVVLSPDTLARDIDVPEADIAAWYESHRSDYGAPEKRSFEVVVAQDEAAAQKLGAAWNASPDWTAIQKAATEAGASVTTLDAALPADIPNPELAQAVFAAAPDVVTGPIKTVFGWQLFRVTKVDPSTERPLAAVHDEIRQRLARERAADQIYDHATRLEDTINSGASFDQIPSDLGATTLGGTLDAQGNTPNNEPAPLPGNPELRQALITAAFATHKGEPPHVIEGPDHSYYAMVVEDETAPQLKPFAAAEDQVREDSMEDARRHEQEVVAAKLLAAVQAGGTLDDAATVAGVHVERTPAIARSAPTPGVPPELTRPIYALAPGKATMVETATGFYVAQLASIDTVEPATDPVGAAQTRDTLDRAIGQDVVMTYVGALRDRDRPTVNRALMDQLSE